MHMVQQRPFFHGAAPRFSGLIMVVALHLGAVMALMIGLQPKNGGILERAFDVTPIDEPIEKIDPPPPPEVTYTPETPIVSVPDFNVSTETSGTSITVHQAKPEPPITIAPKASPTAAKAPAKGLSAPAYPGESKMLGEEGLVELALYLNENGRVQEARIETSSGFPRLDNAALKHAQKAWKFAPCTQDNQPTPCWHKIKFRFQLKDA